MTIQGLAKRYRNEFAWDRYERIASVNKEKKYNAFNNNNSKI